VSEFENVYFRPDWWDALKAPDRDALSARFDHGVGPEGTTGPGIPLRRWLASGRLDRDRRDGKAHLIGHTRSCECGGPSDLVGDESERADLALV